MINDERTAKSENARIKGEIEGVRDKRGGQGLRSYYNTLR